MRIALCADGRSPHSQRWANAVASRGHKVDLIWAHEQLAGADLSPFLASIDHHALTPPSPRRRTWALPAALLGPLTLARRLKPDLVHGIWLAGGGWTARALGVRPLVLTALGSDVHQLVPERRGSIAERAANRYAVWLTRAAVRAADVVFADSTTVAGLIRERAPGTDVRIVRFGVEVKNEPPPSARSEWRQRLEIPNEAFVLLSSRLMNPNYNIDTIIRSLPMILDRVPSAVLVLKELERLGDPEYRRRCLDLVEELGVGAAVRTVGELNRAALLELYAAADVFVSVPTRDATAVSVFEAMSVGVPVVATEAIGIDPAILHKGTALLVPVQTERELAEAVVQLFSDPVVRGRIVHEARRTVERYGDFDSELDRAVTCYEELVASAGTGMRGAAVG